MVLPPIVKRLKPYQSRIARRVVLPFLVSALVPLSLGAVLLFHGFNAELSQAQTRSLDGLLRNFSMTLLGRLERADDLLEAAMIESGRSSELARANVAKLPWVRSVRAELAMRNHSLPKPDSGQERELRNGGTILLTDRDKNGAPTMYLVRAFAGGGWLYAEMDSAWLWADAAGFSGEASLLLLGAQGEVLGSTGVVPDELVRAAAFNVLRHVPADQANSTSNTWVSRSWEIPLAKHYSSPSWRLLAIRPGSTLLHNPNNSALYYTLGAVIALAVLLVAWLSLISIRRQLRPLELFAQAAHHVSQHDFAAFQSLSWNDEFGDLARTFESMSQKLRTQFAALETFAEVDRLLLSNAGLKSILHTLLSRAPGLLGCDAVSVVLFDPDSAGEAQACAYEHYASQPDRRDARSIASGIASLRSACAFPAVQVIHNGQQLYFSPDAPHPINTVRTFPLKNEGRGVGLLCLGYRGEMLDRPDSGVNAGEFADRLSMILVSGRARATPIQPEVQHKSPQRAKLESDMRRALQRGKFKLHYQPIMGGVPGKSVGVEALIRPPSSDEMARISPAELISVAEETGLIIELGDWVLNNACAQFAQWRREGLELGYVAVNVSARQLADPEFLTRLVGALQVQAMAGEELQLEITESVLAHDGALLPVLEKIVARGVRLAMDDFGTGYSSLGCLQTYPIHTVKIDRSLVLDIPQDAAGCRFVESIIVMCGALEKRVVAEGVETEAQRDFLLAAGCGGIQGFLLGRPMKPAQVPLWLTGLPSRFIPPDPRKPWQIVVPETRLKS